MSKAAKQAQLPDWSVPITDGQGVLTDQWRFFLTALFDRTGGYQDGVFAQALETANAVGVIEGLERRLQSLEGRISGLLANVPTQGEQQELRNQVKTLQAVAQNQQNALQVVRTQMQPETLNERIKTDSIEAEAASVGNGGLTSSGGATFTNGFNTDTLTVTTLTTLQNTLTVTASATFSGGLTVSSTATFSNTVGFSSTANFTGTANFGSATVNGLVSGSLNGLWTETAGAAYDQTQLQSIIDQVEQITAELQALK